MLLPFIGQKTVKMDAFIKRLEQLIWSKINLFSVKSEVIYLLEHLDLDRSKDLSMPEILNGSETFLASQMTYFGKIYGKAQVRESVFYIDDSDLAWEIFLHLDLIKAMKSSPLLGPFGVSEFWGFSLLKIKIGWVLWCFKLQTSQLCIDSQYSSEQMTIVWSLIHHSTQPILIFFLG